MALVVGLVGCGESAEQKRIDEIDKRVAQIHKEMTGVGEKCDNLIKKMVQADQQGKVAEAAEFAQSIQSACGEAESLAKEQANLAKEAILLTPRIKS